MLHPYKTYLLVELRNECIVTQDGPGEGPIDRRKCNLSKYGRLCARVLGLKIILYLQ